MLLRVQKSGKYLALSLALQCHLRGITYLVNLFLVLKNPRNGSENRVLLKPLANDRYQEIERQPWALRRHFQKHPSSSYPHISPSLIPLIIQLHSKVVLDEMHSIDPTEFHPVPVPLSSH